jgi:hypothetical protein
MSDLEQSVSTIELDETSRNAALARAVRVFEEAIEPTPDELAADRDLIAQVKREQSAVLA